METKLTVTSVALAAVTAFLVAMPATAATKLFELRLTNAPLVIPGVNLCSASDDLVGKINFHLIIWDQDGDGVGDKGDVQGVSNAKILDSATGDKLGSIFDTASENVNNFGSFQPYILQLNAQAECEGSGRVVDFHIGVTVDNNGGVHFHHIF